MHPAPKVRRIQACHKHTGTFSYAPHVSSHKNPVHGVVNRKLCCTGSFWHPAAGRLCKYGVPDLQCSWPANAKSVRTGTHLAVNASAAHMRSTCTAKGLVLKHIRSTAHASQTDLHAGQQLRKYTCKRCVLCCVSWVLMQYRM